MDQQYINITNGEIWYGKHYILDLYGKIPYNPDEVLNIMENAALAAKATILDSHMHIFDGGGFSGVVVLQESHISIHTWPENEFAAIDVYMCGKCDPLDAIKYMVGEFKPERYEYLEFKRGQLPKTNLASSI